MFFSEKYKGKFFYHENFDPNYKQFWKRAFISVVITALDRE